MQTFPKEYIDFLHFPKEDVLIDKIMIQQRSSALKESMMLGNDYHHKVRIYFEDIEGEKIVETTIWGVTDTQVILKKNMVIPICRIIKIETLY